MQQSMWPPELPLGGVDLHPAKTVYLQLLIWFSQLLMPFVVPWRMARLQMASSLLEPSLSEAVLTPFLLWFHFKWLSIQLLGRRNSCTAVTVLRGFECHESG